MAHARIVVSAALVGYLLGAPSSAPAQLGASAIAGTVRDATGALLPGVTVEASRPALIDKPRTSSPMIRVSTRCAPGEVRGEADVLRRFENSSERGGPRPNIMDWCNALLA